MLAPRPNSRRGTPHRAPNPQPRIPESRNQYAKGDANELNVAAQESQLAQVAATLPPLLKQLAQQRDLLAVLSGGFPNQDLTEKFQLSNLQLPQELPVSLPSQLVEQGPDVRQAEENLHSASAQIGIAVANRLPTLRYRRCWQHGAGPRPDILGRQWLLGSRSIFLLPTFYVWWARPTTTCPSLRRRRAYTINLPDRKTGPGSSDCL